MTFSSNIFLFCFLPVVLGVYFALPRLAWRNLWLLIASFFFYAWGEPAFAGVLIVSLVLNWGLCLWMSGLEGVSRKRLFWVVVLFDLGILVSYRLFPAIPPIGVSFYTFHMISYASDIYRREAPAQTSFTGMAIYPFLFPQLVAGPIVRYKDIAGQFVWREHGWERFSEGVRRFIIGLAKKMILANALAETADKIFAQDPAMLSFGISWIGALCYALQIYYDFSGYSDMAIGLGHLFGFHFKENFDQPYSALSMRDFWRRWHISLSTWFREYVYIPLGGSRLKDSRTMFNLLVVFFLCGLWHGAKWTFVFWGLFHGLFLILERQSWIQNILAARYFPRRFYVWLVVLLSWVFFRSPNMTYAWGYLKALFGCGSAEEQFWYLYPAGYQGAILIVAVMLAILPKPRFCPRPPIRVAALAGLAFLFGYSVLLLAAQTHKPFIYYQF